MHGPFSKILGGRIGVPVGTTWRKKGHNRICCLLGFDENYFVLKEVP